MHNSSDRMFRVGVQASVCARDPLLEASAVHAWSSRSWKGTECRRITHEPAASELSGVAGRQPFTGQGRPLRVPPRVRRQPRPFVRGHRRHAGGRTRLSLPAVRVAGRRVGFLVPLTRSLACHDASIPPDSAGRSLAPRLADGPARNASSRSAPRRGGASPGGVSGGADLSRCFRS